MFLTSFTRASTVGARLRHVSGRAMRCLLLWEIHKLERNSAPDIVGRSGVRQFLRPANFRPYRAVRDVPKLMTLRKLSGFESTKNCFQLCHHYVGIAPDKITRDNPTKYCYQPLDTYSAATTMTSSPAFP